MARGRKKKTDSLPDMPELTKGQIRKREALIKSIGPELGADAFNRWLATQKAGGTDKNADAIAKTLWELVESKKLRISRKGYSVKRGRGRLLVSPLSE